MRSFKDAKKLLKRVGTAHAEGDALAAMYAELIALHHAGNVEKYYVYLCGSDGTSEGIRAMALPLMRDRAKAWDVLMGIVVPS